jgi:hypothetical protein
MDLVARVAPPTMLELVQVVGTDARYGFDDQGSALRMIDAEILQDRDDAGRASFVGGLWPCTPPAAALIVSRPKAHVPWRVDVDASTSPGAAP